MNSSKHTELANHAWSVAWQPVEEVAAVKVQPLQLGVPVGDDLREEAADHIDTIAGMGRQYFGPDKGFKSSLDRSARKAAWRMIRREEGLDDDV
ncbi:hypothetical protein ABZV34_04720 [Streptomyces sp. NPDC005195]|uniref:hypothetical protein n=1 Tax=Streptomyces sp. NPDC005195 TaxID=3154561 RepID=UPI0033A75572